MSYKKPEVVAKSAAKESFVAGCPYKSFITHCTSENVTCMTGRLK